uniref:Homeobox domain-containing protein n=1 Tax=Amphimedon queenslandica TaxID=400682 RepID=A0A1X7VX98_AMPQE
MGEKWLERSLPVGGKPCDNQSLDQPKEGDVEYKSRYCYPQYRGKRMGWVCSSHMEARGSEGYKTSGEVVEAHQTNPYPTKAEKECLAECCGMSVKQLCTWFSNSRRQIRKLGMKTSLEKLCSDSTSIL